jgi:tetratricopeptide (TPR) repeat protein
MSRRIQSLLVFLAVSAWAVPAASAQELPGGRAGHPVEELGTIRVNVRNATGAPLAHHAIVRISQRVGPINWTESTRDASHVEFKGLPVGDYVIEVTAAGYRPTTEEATLFSPSNVMQVYILMQPESAPGTAVGSGPPVLAPKARIEVQDAIQALESNNLNEAEKHLQRAEKMALGHPEIQYLFGLLLARRNDLEGARQRFEKAVSLYPQHATALSGLGRLLFRAGDLTGALSAFERALVVDGNSYENHAALATIFFEQKILEKARYHAEQALHIAAGKLPETRLLLSEILVEQGERQKAADVLKEFLIAYPDHQHAQVAMRLHSALVSGDSSTPLGPAADVPGASASSVPGAPADQRAIRLKQDGIRALPATALTPELSLGAIVPPPLAWAPKDIDETPPAIFHDIPCPQDEVLKRAGQRVAELVDNLRNVNARERIAHTSVDAQGCPGRTETADYEYMFSFNRPRQGVIWVEEFRDGARHNRMVGGVGTSGLAAMALVFHPYYAGDFEMQCEGQGSWKGEAVWYVRFQHREDKTPRMRSFTSERGTARLRFKGRALIAANSFQIVRLETDVLSPPKELRFDGEHMALEYAPVNFKDRKQSFWLPTSVDIYGQVRGKRWHRRHSMSQYVHFSVETKQKIADPRAGSPEPEEARKPPPF